MLFRSDNVEIKISSAAVARDLTQEKTNANPANKYMIMNGKRDDEVGGDPVGSTDPEMILWGPQILRCSRFYNLAQN